MDIQSKLQHRVIKEDDFNKITRIAGIDVGFKASGKITRAAVSVLAFPSLELIETRLASCDTCFPYIPGLLSFRELPAVIKAFNKLQTLPDLCLCDGQGIAHPRRFGIACHLGVMTGLPSIGVGKSRLVGSFGEVPNQRGAWTPLLDKDETIGAVLRTRINVKPVIISTGHRINLSSAIDFVMRCTTRYRLPEPIRMADHRASSR